MLRSRAAALAARALRGSLSEPHAPEAVRGFASGGRRPLSAREVARARDALARRREEREALREPLPPPPAPSARAAQAFGGVALPWDEATLQPVFCGDALVVTREVEWANVIIGFEQANKYTVRDGASGAVVAYLAEETASLGSAVVRQMLGRRRPFTATLLSPAGDVILRVRRPLYLLESTTVLESAEGERVGEIHQKWHLWRRHYDAFLNGEQFGRVRSGLLAWDFVVEDAQGRELCRVDRNFSGLGLELFTDAGAYALHFTGAGAQTQLAGGGAAITGGSAAGDAVAVLPPPRPLELSERAATLALAVAIDFDYFSRLSSGAGGGILPMGGMGMPIPMPFPGGMGGGGAEAAAVGAAGEASESPAEEPAAAAEPERDWRSGEDLGGDEFKPDVETPTWGEEEDDGGDDDDGGGDDGGGGGGMWGALGQLMGIDRDE